jgi:hypothetical protein
LVNCRTDAIQLRRAAAHGKKSVLSAPKPASAAAKASIGSQPPRQLFRPLLDDASGAEVLCIPQMSHYVKRKPRSVDSLLRG